MVAKTVTLVCRNSLDHPILYILTNMPIKLTTSVEQFKRRLWRSNQSLSHLLVLANDWMENLCVNLHLQLLLLDSKTNNLRQPIAVSSNPRWDIIHRALLVNLKANSSSVQMLSKLQKKHKRYLRKRLSKSNLKRKRSQSSKLSLGKSTRSRAEQIPNDGLRLWCFCWLG